MSAHEGEPRTPEQGGAPAGDEVRPEIESAPRKDAGGVRPKAVGLVSGGLDSTLAAEMMTRQGLDVTGLYFSTGFCKTDHRRAVQRAKDRDPERLRNEALRAGADGGFPVEVIDVSEEYLQEVVLHPKHGYGQHINPCIDCRIFMLRKAKDYADAIGAETVFTGEVIGQRPFSQYRSALRLIEEQSGLEGRLLRPLSAKHLEPTRAEAEGRLDRDALGAFGGRARRDQEDLARAYGIEDYPQPSGGCCFLADAAYARRFKELLAHLGTEGIDREEVLLLKVGRQFRLSPASKLHVGRDDAENRFLQRFAPGRWRVEAEGLEGPTAIVNGAPGDAELDLAASIVMRYADREGGTAGTVVLSYAAPGPRTSSRGNGTDALDDSDVEADTDNCGSPARIVRRLHDVVAADPSGLEALRV